MSNRLKSTVLGIFCLTLLSFPGISYADHHGHGGHHYYNWHDHPHYGWRTSILPEVCFSLLVGGMMYYYFDGIYYSRVDREYVVVNPPVGATVRVIPSEFRPIVINGVTYYTDNGTYYVYTPQGYQVVPSPIVVSQPIPVAPLVITQTQAPVTAQTQIVEAQPLQSAPQTAAAPIQETEDSFTVNIPDDRGGFIPVVIRRSGKGFVGPQGEYYHEFPKVAQLKLMYGK